MSQSVFLLAALDFGVDASVFLDSVAAGGETACWGARTGASTSMGCPSIMATIGGAYRAMDGNSEREGGRRGVEIR